MQSMNTVVDVPVVVQHQAPMGHWATGHWATGPLGHWATGPLGHWATGPMGHWANGPWPMAHGPMHSRHSSPATEEHIRAVHEHSCRRAWCGATPGAHGPLGHWATGLLGQWANGPTGPWAHGPMGQWATGRLGHWAMGQITNGPWPMAHGPMHSRHSSRATEEHIRAVHEHSCRRACCGATPGANGPMGQWATGPLGHWATGPLGHWATGPLGHGDGPMGQWANGPMGQWANWPLGHWATGPPGHWATGPLGQWERFGMRPQLHCGVLVPHDGVSALPLLCSAPPSLAIPVLAAQNSDGYDPKLVETLLLHSLLVREAKMAAVSTLVKDGVDQTVSVAAPVAALVTSYHVSVPVSAGGPSSSVSLSSASNSLGSACPDFSFLGDPSGWSAIERDPDCEYVSFGSESFEVLFSRRSKLRFLRDGSWHLLADGSAMVLVCVSSGKAFSSCAIRPDELLAASWSILTAIWSCLALLSRLVPLLCRLWFTLVARIVWSSFVSPLLTLAFF